MNIQQHKEAIENQIIAAGLEYSFIACCDSNGKSIYFEINGLKCRFSDHTVTNVDRIMNEVHFPLAVVISMGMGGVEKTKVNNLFVHKINMKYQQIIWNRIKK